MLIVGTYLFSETFYLTNGKIIEGEIKSIENNNYIIETEYGDLKIPKENVKEIKSSPIEDSNSTQIVVDSNELQKYEEKKAWLSLTKLVNTSTNTLVSTKYKVLQGEYSKSSLSLLAKEMGDLDLSKKLAIAQHGDTYRALAIVFGGLTGFSIVGGAVMIGLGFSQNGLLLFISSAPFTLGLLTLTTCFVMVGLAVFSKRNGFDVNQAQKYVNKYNA
jgi:hypothetical protein